MLMHVRGDYAIGIATLPSTIKAAAQTSSQSTGRERGGAGVAASLGQAAARWQELRDRVSTIVSMNLHNTQAARSCRSQRSLRLLPAAVCFRK